jgi:hypothetical protein
MCEECESDQSLAQSYAQKRARMRAYWTPKRKVFGFNAAEATTTNDPQPQSETLKTA